MVRRLAAGKEAVRIAFLVQRIVVWVDVVHHFGIENIRRITVQQTAQTVRQAVWLAVEAATQKVERVLVHAVAVLVEMSEELRIAEMCDAVVVAADGYLGVIQFKQLLAHLE